MENQNAKTFLDMARERWSVRKFAPEQISKTLNCSKASCRG